MTTFYFTTREWTQMPIERRLSFTTARPITIQRHGRYVTEWMATR